jgi:hypothetical protein
MLLYTFPHGGQNMMLGPRASSGDCLLTLPTFSFVLYIALVGFSARNYSAQTEINEWFRILLMAFISSAPKQQLISQKIRGVFFHS